MNTLFAVVWDFAKHKAFKLWQNDCSLTMALWRKIPIYVASSFSRQKYINISAKLFMS